MSEPTGGGPKKAWKCYNCGPVPAGSDFAAADPVCPDCGADGRTPEGAGVVLPRTVIHLDPPHPVYRGKGLKHLACQPAVKVGTGGRMATGDPRQVSCPACQRTEAYQAAAAAFGDKSNDIPE